MSKKNEYFNITMQGFGYINQVSETDNIVRFSVTMLHGKSKKPKKEYYSLTGTQKVIEILNEFEKEINDNDVPVFANIIVSKGDSQAFMRENETLGITHFGSILDVSWMKVGDNVVLSSEK